MASTSKKRPNNKSKSNKRKPDLAQMISRSTKEAKRQSEKALEPISEGEESGLMLKG